MFYYCHMWPWTTKLNFVWIEQYLAEIQQQQKNLNTGKIAFKVVQMKFLAMHITNQKLIYLR